MTQRRCERKARCKDTEHDHHFVGRFVHFSSRALSIFRRCLLFAIHGFSSPSVFPDWAFVTFPRGFELPNPAGSWSGTEIEDEIPPSVSPNAFSACLFTSAAPAVT